MAVGDVAGAGAKNKRPLSDVSGRAEIFKYEILPRHFDSSTPAQCGFRANTGVPACERNFASALAPSSLHAGPDHFRAIHLKLPPSANQIMKSPNSTIMM